MAGFAGEEVGEFVLVERVDAGGMGTIWRARDAAGAPVALKLMVHLTEAGRARFSREASVLATLRYEGIVAYRGHGEHPTLGPFLAMDWLEGEDLSARLGRAPLTADEAIDLGRRVADALAHAHAVGIVHRDIKPANLFLVDGDPSKVRLLDFGIARPRGGAGLTATGAVMGTVGYMAPEQAEGRRDVDARADLFSLGCVLHECLLGGPTFTGDHVVAVLVKILREEPPRLCAVRPELPARLDALVASLLQKDAAHRPPSAEVVARELEALGRIGAGAPGARPSPPPTPSEERRIQQVVLVDPLETRSSHELAPTLVPAAAAETLDAGLPREVERIRSAVVPLGARAWLLHNGVLSIALPERGSARDRSVVAAGVARAVLEVAPSVRVAIAAGRGDGSHFGACVDACAHLLASVAPGEIGVDETTARLAEARFEVQASRDGLRLGRELPARGEERRLLGRAVPCVGRAKELALLRSTAAEAFEEPAARSVLVVAAAGAGKSRLLREVLGQANRPGAERLLFARGEPLEAGASLAIVQRVVRAAADIPAEADGEAAARALTTLFGEDAPGRTARVELLCELAGKPLLEAQSQELRAARADPAERRAWLERAFGELLDVLTADRPLILALDDLHWADPVSIAWLGEALRTLHDRPLLVLGAARPDCDALFRAPWPSCQRLVLEPLTKRAAGALVRAALGEARDDVVARVVEQAQGNAFFLEELTRAAGEGHAELPETVQAMVESRLLALPPQDRAALRAASVLGDPFDAEGVAAVSELSVAALRDPLDALAAREVLQPERGLRGAWSFRHAVVRDVAYAMIPAAELPALHGRTARWLEATGRADPLALSRHLDVAGERERATEQLVLALERSYLAGDFDGTLALAERALARPLSRDQRARVCVNRGGVLVNRGDPEMLGASRDAAEHADRGSALWVRAIGGVAGGAALLGRIPDLLEALELLVSVAPGPTAPFGVALWNGVTSASFLGRPDLLARLSAHAERALALPDPDILFSAFVRAALVVPGVLFDPPLAGGLAAALRHARELEALQPRLASVFPRVSSRFAIGYAHWAAGQRGRAADDFRRTVDDAAQSRLTTFATLGAVVLADVHRQARDLEIPLGSTLGLQVLSAAARARLAFERGDLDTASRLAADARDASAVVRWVAPSVLTLSSELAAARGERDQALAFALEACASERASVCPLVHRAEAWLGLGTVFRARGEHPRAEEVIASGRARLLALAAGLEPSDWSDFRTAEPYVHFELPREPPHEAPFAGLGTRAVH